MRHLVLNKINVLNTNYLRYGRKPIIFLSFVIIVISGFGTALGPQKIFGVWPSYVIYSACRFLVAVGTRGIYFKWSFLTHYLLIIKYIFWGISVIGIVLCMCL